MYETLKSAFEHRSVTEYDRMSARALARRLDPSPPHWGVCWGLKNASKNE